MNHHRRLYLAVTACRQLLRQKVPPGTAAAECACRWGVSSAEVMRLSVVAEDACRFARAVLKREVEQHEQKKPKGGRRVVTADC